MTLRVPPLAAARIVAALALAASLGGGCKDDKSEDIDVIARWTLVPQGGTFTGGPVTLELPPGALAAEQEVELRGSSTDLSALDYVQVGSAYDFSEPLIFKLPARLTISGDAMNPVVMFRQDGLTVTSNASSAYINELGAIALAEGGTPHVTSVAPAFGATPEQAGAPLRDAAHMSVMVSDTPQLNLALTIYDPTDYYTKPLNGTGEGDCGFKLENVLGGSLSAGCSEGPLSASIGVTSAQIEFDVVPFLAGKMETAVVVGVVAGGDELAHMLGFFAFDTSLCFEETCSGYGTCSENGSEAVCQCIDGYAADGLECNCVPQCDGRECGGDSCGGNCLPGCDSDVEFCDDNGQCVPNGNDTSGGESTSGNDDSTGGGNESSGGGNESSGADMGSTSGGDSGSSGG
jgi:hypothetical protein